MTPVFHEGIAHEFMWLIFMVVTLTMPGMRIQVHGGLLMFIDVQCGLQSKKCDLGQHSNMW